MAENQQKTSFLDKFKSPISYLWDNHRVFLIIFGLAIVVFKFREIIIDFLISDSRKKVKESQEKDVVLKAEQKQANDEAEQLIKEAEDLNKNKPKVDEDWYQK